MLFQMIMCQLRVPILPVGILPVAIPPVELMPVELLPIESVTDQDMFFEQGNRLVIKIILIKTMKWAQWPLALMSSSLNPRSRSFKLSL